MEIAAEYDDAEKHPIEFKKDNDVVNIIGTNGNGAIIEAVKAGKSVIAYGNGFEEKSFTVVVVDPTLTVEMVSQETEDSTLSNTAHGYRLYIPAGTTAKLEIGFDDIQYGYCFKEKEGEKHAKIDELKGYTHRYAVSALTEGVKKVEIWTEGLQVNQSIIELEISVGPHIVVSDIENSYTLFEGDSLEIDVAFSDEKAVNLRKDIEQSGDQLKIDIPANKPNTIKVEGVKAGSEDVRIGNKDVRFTVYAVPTLSDEEDYIEKRDDGFDVVLPANQKVEIPIENLADDLTIFLEEDTDLKNTNLFVDHDRKMLMIQAGSFTGRGSYSVTARSRKLFSVNVEVVESTAVTHFEDQYVMFEGDETNFTLEYKHVMGNMHSAFSSDPSVAEVALSDDGANATLVARKPGNAEVTLGGKTFSVVVCAADVGLVGGDNLTLQDGVYYLTVKDTSEVSLAVSGWNAEAYALSLDRTNGSASAIRLMGDRLAIMPENEGEDAYTLRSNGTVSDREVVKLVVRVKFEKELNTNFENQYEMLENSRMKIRLDYKNNFAADVSASSSNPDIVSASSEINESGKYLTMFAFKEGNVQINVEGKTFAVNVVKPKKLLNDQLMVDENGNYALTLYKGEKAKIRFEDNPSEYRIMMKYGNNETEVSGEFEVTGDNVGDRSYVFTAVEEQYSTVMYSLKVTVQESALTTQFKKQYAFVEGERASLSLEFKKAVCDLAIRCSGIEVTQDGKKLNILAEKTGTYTVSVEDTYKEQKFEVKVIPPEVRLTYMDGADVPMEGNNYIIELSQGESAEINLNTHERISEYAKVSISSFVPSAGMDMFTAMMNATPVMKDGIMTINGGNFPVGEHTLMLDYAPSETVEITLANIKVVIR